MQQTEFNKISKSTKFDQVSKDDLIKNYQILESELSLAIKEIHRLKNQHLSEQQLKLVQEEYLEELRKALYGASSERYKKSPNPEKENRPPKPRIKRPSDRYPNVPVRDIPITFEPVPGCDVCGKTMSDSSMTEDSEQLTIIPKKFEILRYKRSIYRCSCQSCMKTAPTPERIVEGSTYSDEMIMDVALSKYCDLIPIERYVAMAARTGLENLPPNTLIDLTHKFAFFVKEVYRLIKSEVMAARVMNADETPHRMLEGSDKKSWYLWGFSTPTLCFLECHDTRSGDVVSEILVNSNCEILVSDVYAGYGKAIRLANLSRGANNKKLIKNAYCNSHARRNFFKLRHKYSEATFYLDHYHEIYKLNSRAKEKPPDEILNLRALMEPHFAAMRDRALKEAPLYPSENKYGRALNYFLDNYEGLILALFDAGIPIDNNSQERLLRNHVVGRKTWYGTHSEQGAETAAIMFSIVETCKLNKVNPREYFPAIIEAILKRQKVFTPYEYKLNREALQGPQELA